MARFTGIVFATFECMEIQIPIGEIALEGTLTVPEDALGLVMFVHGSGSSRFSPRNRHVAAALHERRLATLLFDLLTPEEERIDAIDTTLRSDVEMLAERLVAAIDSIVTRPEVRHLPIGLFGGSTGAAAALIAAGRRPSMVSAVVSRGGRIDLAGGSLATARAPTLMIVGGADTWVLKANRYTAPRMTAPHRLVVVANATHLFEEPGALDEVARLAGAWFVDHFALARAEEAS